MGNCVAAEAGAVITPVSKPTRTVLGDRRAVFFDVTLSSSYATGGDNLDFSLWFKLAVDFVDMEAATSGGTVYRPEYVRAATVAGGKLKMYSGVGAGNAEVTAATNLSTVSLRMMVIGK